MTQITSIMRLAVWVARPQTQPGSAPPLKMPNLDLVEAHLAQLDMCCKSISTLHQELLAVCSCPTVRRHLALITEQRQAFCDETELLMAALPIEVKPRVWVPLRLVAGQSSPCESASNCTQDASLSLASSAAG